MTEPFNALALMGVEKTKQLCETLNYINESKVLGKLEPDIKEIINSILTFQGDIEKFYKIYEKKMNLISSEEVFNKRLNWKINITETILNDIKNNTEYLITESASTGESHILQEMTTRIKNRTGKVIGEERLDASMIKGLFNIAQINENGTIEDLALGIENEKGFP